MERLSTEDNIELLSLIRQFNPILELIGPKHNQTEAETVRFPPTVRRHIDGGPIDEEHPLLTWLFSHGLLRNGCKFGVSTDRYFSWFRVRQRLVRWTSDGYVYYWELTTAGVA